MGGSTRQSELALPGDVQFEATRPLNECSFEDQFEVEFSGDSLDVFSPNGVEFERCTFRGVQIAKFSAMNCTFIDCTFEDCGLALSNWTGASLRGCVFRGCKLTGANWSGATWNAFSSASPLVFEECDLSHSMFAQIRIVKTIFRNCKMIDVDFSDGDLTSVEFDMCELERANFSRANLSKADLRTVSGYCIDPTSSVLQGARFSRHKLEGLVTTFGLKLEADEFN